MKKKAAKKSTSRLSSKSKIQIGSVAPDATFHDQDGKEISLKEYIGKGPIVLYFYPKAMTLGCTIQARGIRDSIQQFRKRGAFVVGVSPDEPKRLCKFQEKEDLNFPLWGDVDHSAAEAFGVWQKKKFMGREFMGIVRTTFVIGGDGKIKHIMDDVQIKTHHDAVLKVLDSIRLES